ncbi:uncharacterized protein LOC129602087 [Paramacrobiotus metropolitanus]|uniref:uncharacterized protein LOC129602087 n=1 Tax=Paramacrobiotus metropolitanus TaxID=2943436 RepID=UPI0024461C38|nr:uncharacterized protein LOC129602087 [Paramacrobiotus metropolitanus]
MLKGAVPHDITPMLYGANLFAYKKKDSGIRPIAVGTSLRRVFCRIVTFRLRHLNKKLQPIQLGFATKGGVEAAVHAARSFIEDAAILDKPQVFLKLDVKNAFNSLDQNYILKSAEEFMPEYYKFVWQCYGEPSILLHGKYSVSSQAGIQQGDPLGPLLYCLATTGPHKRLKSKLKECFLDNDALGGDPEDVFDDLRSLQEALRVHWLTLNIAKCELMVIGGSEKERQTVYGAFLHAYPDLLCPQLKDLHYLGAPIHDDAVAGALVSVTEVIARMTKRLNLIPAHQALYLLRCSMGTVKLIYKLRASRCYQQKALLKAFDDIIRQSLTSITNVNITEGIWMQASLPIIEGGLGIRSVETLALPAFLASAYSVAPLTSEIIEFQPQIYCRDAAAEWQEVTQLDLPHHDARPVQKVWDNPIVQNTVERLRTVAGNDISEQARLNGVSTKENGAWLGALPAASLGNLLTDSAVRIVVGLRLGAPIITPHRCVCGEWADARGYHGLSCKKSRGRIPTHKCLNAIVKRSLALAGFERELEPQGIFPTDSKRLDGVTLTPWERGRMLAWDATCVNTMAISHIVATSTRAGAAAAQAEQGKIEKYRDIGQDYLFRALGFETLGPPGPEAVRTITEFGQKIRQETGEKRATEYLRQRISIEMQRGNAASIMGTAPMGANLDQIFCVIRPPLSIDA